MTRHYLFISDIHLRDDNCPTTKPLYNLLEQQVPKAQALFILGDFFDLWLGDDNLAPFQKTIAKLKQASLHTPIYFIPGNHDFLIGPKLCQLTGITALPDPYVTQIFGQKCLLSHGDLLCSQDIAYQRFRSIVQHSLTKACFNKLPLTWRQHIAQKLQNNSQQQTAKKSMKIMDVNESCVQQWLDQHQATTLIHGHTHAPKQHKYKNNKARWVLGAWHDTPNVIRWDSDGEITSVNLQI
jgi:UDP-2,3-diacylglucosamine hydrolase